MNYSAKYHDLPFFFHKLPFLLIEMLPFLNCFLITVPFYIVFGLKSFLSFTELQYFYSALFHSHLLSSKISPTFFFSTGGWIWWFRSKSVHLLKTYGRLHAILSHHMLMDKHDWVLGCCFYHSSSLCWLWMDWFDFYHSGCWCYRLAPAELWNAFFCICPPIFYMNEWWLQHPKNLSHIWRVRITLDRPQKTQSSLVLQGQAGVFSTFQSPFHPLYSLSFHPMAPLSL